MDIASYSKEIVSVVVSIGTILVNRLPKGKSQLICAQRHSSNFVLREVIRDDGSKIPGFSVRTQSYFVRNDGKEPLTGIELVWNWKPEGTNLWPPRPYADHIENDGRYSISIKTMSPREEILFEMITFGEMPNMVICRCDQSMARHVELNFFEKVPPWKVWGFRLLSFAGVAAIVYGVLALLQIVVLTGRVGM